MNTVRQPAVAGMFYPAAADELAREVRDDTSTVVCAIEHDGVVPRGVDALQELTGIGQYAARATACVLASSRLMPVARFSPAHTSTVLHWPCAMASAA